MSLPVLWQYSFSNFNEKARWALDFKGIPHRRRSLMPGGPKALRFSRGDGTLPVLDLDGRRIVDSTRIIEALEERNPEPALYPEEGQARQRALDLEDFFDEHAGHDMRMVGFWESRDETRFGAEFMSTDQPGPVRAGARVMARVMQPFVWRYVTRRYGFSQEHFERSLDALRAALDRIESERSGREHLVGDFFTVADLTAAALLYPLIWPPEYPYELPEQPPSPFIDSIQGHPALDWLRSIWRDRSPSSAV